MLAFEAPDPRLSVVLVVDLQYVSAPDPYFSFVLLVKTGIVFQFQIV